MAAAARVIGVEERMRMAAQLWAAQDVVGNLAAQIDEWQGVDSSLARTLGDDGEYFGAESAGFCRKIRTVALKLDRCVASEPRGRGHAQARRRDSMHDSDAKLKATQFVVEATSCEHQLLWEQFSKDTIHKTPQSVHRWENVNPGYVIEVGRFFGFSVNIGCRWDVIDGVWVMFYEDISRVVDHDLIKKWLNENCCPRWCNGSRLARTNAMNFHHVLDYIRNVDQR